MRVADRRSRSTFWLDDALIDRCGPWLGRFPGGTVAIAVYVCLARHADRASEAYPSVTRLSSLVGASRSGVQRALRLLELAGMIAVVEAFDAETDKQLSNTYVLLTPPDALPDLSVNPDDWPDVLRERVRVRHGADGRRMVEDARLIQNTCSPLPTGDTGEGPYMTRGGPTGDTHRARDLLSEGKPIEGNGPSTDEKTTETESAEERWRRRYGEYWERIARRGRL